MSLNTVIAKRTTKDHMLSNDLAPDTIIISPAMMKSFRLARQKYYIHLEEGKKNKGGSDEVELFFPSSLCVLFFILLPHFLK